MFRPLTLIAALCVAVLIYLSVVALLVQRLNRMIHVTVGSASRTQVVPLIAITNGQVRCLGRSAPLSAVIGTAAIPPVWWVASTLHAASLRRARERLGQCIECGTKLTRKRGRCPCCGERFERTLPREPLIPVVDRKRILR